jgi:hypothetical protein
MQRCEFAGNLDKPCPVPENWSWVLLREPCTQDRYGQNCAAICGQEIVARSVDVESGQSEIDSALGMITAQFRLTSVPAGLAPEEIRQSITNTTFPLREKRPNFEGKVFVNHADLYLTLLNSEKLQEANWYNDYAKDEEIVKKGFNWWCFEMGEGNISELRHPKSSLDNYDQSFLMGAATLWNTFAPPLLIVREAMRPGGVYPISEYFEH